MVASPELQADIELIRDQIYSKIDKSIIKDEGTCVIGGGIKLKFFRHGKRTPNTLLLMGNPFQGNISSYAALKPCIEYLNKHFSQAGFYYEEGNMD